MVVAWLTAGATPASGTAQTVTAGNLGHRSTALRLHFTRVARNLSENLSLVVPGARVFHVAA